jgi:hypothetical protein
VREGMDRVSTLLLVQLSRDAPALTALRQAVGTKLLLTPAMSADILMLVKVTHHLLWRHVFFLRSNTITGAC